jgi:hypothetical protein
LLKKLRKNRQKADFPQENTEFGLKKFDSQVLTQFLTGKEGPPYGKMLELGQAPTVGSRMSLFPRFFDPALDREGLVKSPQELI